ncbi:MAG: response regulator [Candidatus Edwardsbacteria bacterium]
MSKKILLIEDSRPLGSLLREVLKRSGYSVTFFTSIKEALSKMKEGKFGLVLIEYGLSKEPVLEAISKLKEIDREIKIVLLADDFLKDDFTLEELRADRALFKPFTNQQFLAMVEEVFSKNKKS